MTGKYYLLYRRDGLAITEEHNSRLTAFLAGHRAEADGAIDVAILPKAEYNRRVS
jgi:hypothetical protein